LIRKFYVALAHRKVNAASAQVRLKFTDFVPLLAASFDEIQNAIGYMSRFDFTIIPNSRNGDIRLDPNIWSNRPGENISAVRDNVIICSKFKILAYFGVVTALKRLKSVR